jgi:hypothetical protein
MQNEIDTNETEGHGDDADKEWRFMNTAEAVIQQP